MFTSDSQHPPRSRHAVYLGADIGSGSSIFLLHNIYLEAHMTVNPARVARGSIERLKQKRYNFIGMTLFIFV